MNRILTGFLFGFLALHLISVSRSFAATVSYAYDSLNRLTNAAYGSAAEERLSYDPAGNRLRRETINTLSLSDISPRTISSWAASDPVSILFGSDTGGTLSVSAKSSNPALIPSSGLIITGSGSNRLLEISPMTGATGTAVIHVIVSNGSVATTTTFIVTVIDNHPPLAINDSAQHPPGEGVKIELTKLLANDSDSDGDTFALTSLSPLSEHGGSVRRFGPFVLYDPPAGFDGVDTFIYTIADTNGLTATATVTVKGQPPARAFPITIVSAEILPNGNRDIHFIGVPNTTYQIEASTDASAWTLVGTSASDNRGRYSFEDAETQRYPVRFYRSVYR